jgi:DNA-binding protein HU-beta
LQINENDENLLTFIFRYVNQLDWEYKMNKKNIADNIYRKAGIKRFEAYGFVDFLIEAIIDHLRKDKKVVLSNFGTLKVVTRREKKVIHPNNKQELVIPERKTVKFLPSQKLKDTVRSGK